MQRARDLSVRSFRLREGTGRLAYISSVVKISNYIMLDVIGCSPDLRHSKHDNDSFVLHQKTRVSHQSEIKTNRT